MAELTPEQIRLEQERLDLIEKQNAAAKELASTYEKIAKSKIKLTQDEKNILGLTKQVADMSSTLEKSINKRLSGSASIKDLEKSITALKNDQVRNGGALRDYEEKINKLKQKALEGFKKSFKEENLQKDLLRKAHLEELKIMDEIDALKKGDGDSEKIADARKQLVLQRDIVKDYQDQLSKATKLKENQKEIFKQLEASKKAHEKIKEEQQKEIELAEQTLAETKKREAKEAIIGTLKKQLRIDEIKDMFTIAGLLKIIIDAAVRFNNTSVQIGKNLGYGADQADRVTSNLTSIANSSSNLNVNLKNLGEAMSQLNEATGGVAEYSADALETQILLTKQFGLTGDEAAGIYKFSVLTGKASSTINKEMAGAFASTRNSVRGSANFKTTMAEVSKISGQLAANFKNNPAELTKAVVQAQALGTTLEKAKSQGEALLNFESSIENELKAELLTGQQMNLERARAAALMGDQVTVAKELANQGMTLEKFQNMNVLAQKSFAEALGLSADELSEQLKKQKIAQEQGKSLAQITEEEALEAQKRQNIQDKFNAAIEKLQDLIGSLVAGPLGKFLEIITDILSNTTLLSALLGGALIANLRRVKKASIGSAIADIIGGAWKALGGLYVIGPALAGAAIAGGIAYLNSKTADDMISPGYGKRTILSPEGSIRLNDNDTIVAGTNLGGDGKGESISPTIDLTPMIAAINQVKASVDRLYNKDTSINMDGKKVGTTLTQGSYKVA